MQVAALQRKQATQGRALDKARADAQAQATKAEAALTAEAEVQGSGGKTLKDAGAGEPSVSEAGLSH